MATNEYPGSVHCHPARPAQTPITAPHADAPHTHADVRRCVHPPQCMPPHWYADTAAAVSCGPAEAAGGRCLLMVHAVLTPVVVL